MRELITLNLKARFHREQIRLMWYEFWAQRDLAPDKDLYILSSHYDYRGQQDREVWVKVENQKDEQVATMLLPEDY